MNTVVCFGLSEPDVEDVVLANGARVEKVNDWDKGVPTQPLVWFSEQEVVMMCCEADGDVAGAVLVS